MAQTQGIPRGAAVAIDDMLDHCARSPVRARGLVLAQIDGLYGGDNLVDDVAISWIQGAIQARGANASVLWIDEPVKPHAWQNTPHRQSRLEQL